MAVGVVAATFGLQALPKRAKSPKGDDAKFPGLLRRSNERCKAGRAAEEVQMTTKTHSMRARIISVARNVSLATVALSGAWAAIGARVPNVVNALNPIPSRRLYVEPSTPAKKQADA